MSNVIKTLLPTCAFTAPWSYTVSGHQEIHPESHRQWQTRFILQTSYLNFLANALAYKH